MTVFPHWNVPGVRLLLRILDFAVYYLRFSEDGRRPDGQSFFFPHYGYHSHGILVRTVRCCFQLDGLLLCLRLVVCCLHFSVCQIPVLTQPVLLQPVLLPVPVLQMVLLSLLVLQSQPALHFLPV